MPPRFSLSRGRAGSRPGTPPQERRLEPVPDTFLPTVVLLGIVAVALVLQGGAGRALQLAVVAAAVCVGYVAPRRLAWAPAIAAVAAYLAVEGANGRLVSERYWVQVFHASAIAAAVFAAAYVRHARELRDAGLALALSREDDVRERQSLGDALQRGARSLSSLELELERARRHNHRVSLLRVRPDDLDDVLERYGEPGVRDVLEQVAEAIGTHTRATDVATRGAGFDFCLVLPETEREGARTLAERIRLDVAARSVEPAPGERIDLAVSVGVACFPEDARTNEELGTAADRALRGAVALGGNRTLLASAPAGAPAGWALEPARAGSAGS